MTWLSLLLAVVLLAGNAFFVGAQFALISTRTDQIDQYLRAGSRGARAAAGQMRQLPTMLAGSQLGIAVCSLGLGAVAEPAVAHLIEAGFRLVRLPTALLHPVAFALALAAVAYGHMVVGEMVPKNLALAGPVRAALLFGPPMAGWVRLTRPVLWGLNAVSDRVLRLGGVTPRGELASAYTASELAEMITESTAEGLLHPQDEQRLARALRLRRRTARDLAIPLDRLVTVSPSVTPAQLERLVADTGFSRFPMVDASGQITSFLHVKDILGPARRDAPVPAPSHRSMSTIDGDLPLSRTLTALRRAGSHLGRVVQDGRTVGVIALEDVIEEFVGEVRDASHQIRGRRDR